MRARIVLLCALAACGQPRVYICAQDSDCVMSGTPGRCESNGFCSFADVGCESGARYGELSPAELAGTCVTQPANDACENAPSLTLGEPIQGDLRGAAASALLACSPQATGDSFYTLELAECSDVTLRAEAAGGNLAVGLVRDCSETLGCADEHQTSAAEVMELPGVPAGSYQIGVGGVFYDGTFSVTASIAPPPTNDVLGSAVTLTPAVLATPQSLARAADDLVCAGREGARDLFYGLELGDSGPGYRWVVDVDVAGHASDDFAVALIDPAVPAPPVCSSAPAHARFHDLEGGTGESRVLAVDGPLDGSCGGFDLDVKATKVSDDNRCGAVPIANQIWIPGSATITRDLNLATDEYTGSCATQPGNDIAHPLHVDVRSRVDIRVTGGFAPVVYVRSGFSSCETESDVARRVPKCAANHLSDSLVTEVACKAHPFSPHLVVTLEPGDYEIIVDSESGAGMYQLEVTTLQPEGDDAPVVLSIPSNECENVACCVVGTTVGATEASSNLNCGPASGKEVQYTIPVKSGCNYPVAVLFITSPEPHWVRATKVCGMVLTPLGCAEGLGSPQDGYTATIGFDADATLQSCAIKLWVIANDVDDNFSILLDHRGGILNPVTCQGP